MADTLFTNVRILDGSGQNPFSGSVLVQGNRIRQVGRSTAPIAGGNAVVIDGAVRDSVAIRELGLPMYAAGLNPNGPTKFVPGRLNHPISIGGVTVNAGDLLVGDADGVTVIERAKAAAMLPLAADKLAAETQRIADIKSRKALRPGWLDGALRAAGVIKEGEKL